MKRFHRRSTRLKGHDYSVGTYFVTICMQRGRKRSTVLMGKVVDGEMRLNDVGRMVKAALREIPRRYPGVRLDAFVIMPDHIHVIFVLVGATPVVALCTTSVTVMVGPVVNTSATVLRTAWPVWMPVVAWHVTSWVERGNHGGCPYGCARGVAQDVG